MNTNTQKKFWSKGSIHQLKHLNGTYECSAQGLRQLMLRCKSTRLIFAHEENSTRELAMRQAVRMQIFGRTNFLVFKSNKQVDFFCTYAGNFIEESKSVQKENFGQEIQLQKESLERNHVFLIFKRSQESNTVKQQQHTISSNSESAHCETNQLEDNLEGFDPVQEDIYGSVEDMHRSDRSIVSNGCRASKDKPEKGSSVWQLTGIFDEFDSFLDVFSSAELFEGGSNQNFNTPASSTPVVPHKLPTALLRSYLIERTESTKFSLRPWNSIHYSIVNLDEKHIYTGPNLSRLNVQTYDQVHSMINESLAMLYSGGINSDLMAVPFYFKDKKNHYLEHHYMLYLYGTVPAVIQFNDHLQYEHQQQQQQQGKELYAVGATPEAIQRILKGAVTLRPMKSQIKPANQQQASMEGGDNIMNQQQFAVKRDQYEIKTVYSVKQMHVIKTVQQIMCALDLNCVSYAPSLEPLKVVQKKVLSPRSTVATSSPPRTVAQEQQGKFFLGEKLQLESIHKQANVDINRTNSPAS